ncbi:MAG TPA: hypothetical protein VGK90_09720 [Rhizomicrobium sp.]
MTGWNDFFLGELSAAAALAGLLFVAVSVNQARILQLGRMADRGLEALIMLFAALTVASLPLMPGQPVRLLGCEILVIGIATLVGMVFLQRAYLRALEQTYRPRSMMMVGLNRVAISIVALGGLIILSRGDGVGLYVIAAGILATFLAVGANAWVLLIEINR